LILTHGPMCTRCFFFSVYYHTTYYMYTTPTLVLHVSQSIVVRLYFHHVQLQDVCVASLRAQPTLVPPITSSSSALTRILPTLGVVRPKSPCTNSLTYVPADVLMVSMKKRRLSQLHSAVWMTCGTRCSAQDERGRARRKEARRQHHLGSLQQAPSMQHAHRSHLRHLQ
jgi:hypothetical protein